MRKKLIPICDCNRKTGKTGKSTKQTPTTTNNEGQCNHCQHYVQYRFDDEVELPLTVYMNGYAKRKPEDYNKVDLSYDYLYNYGYTVGGRRWFIEF